MFGPAVQRGRNAAGGAAGGGVQEEESDHAETTVSSPAVTRTEPSAAKVIALIALKCAGQVRTSRPVETSQMYAAPVSEPAAKWAPSGEAAITPMGSPTKNLCSADSLSRPHTSSAFLDTCAETERTRGGPGGR